MMHDNWFRSRPLFSPPPRPPAPKKRWRLFYILKTAVRRTCTALGALILFSALMGLLVSSLAGREVAAPPLPSSMVLVLALDHGLVEHADVASGGYGFSRKALTVREVVGGIDAAAKDERVRGLVLDFYGADISLAHIQELRAAIARFRAAGKFTHAYAPSYESLGDYYLAGAFENIWLQPVGTVTIPGLHAEIPYARALLEKIGVEPQVFARKEYKSLFESATDKEMSPASREMMTGLVGSLGRTILSDIAADRGIDKTAAQKLIDKGLFTDTEALAAGLIDRLEHTDVLDAEVKKLVTGDPETPGEDVYADLQTYLAQAAPAPHLLPAGHKKPKVALIYAAGEITQYDETGLNLAAAETLVANINEAADDKNIGVIVLRIDSPGGDPTAAETIRRAILKAREKEKKIIVSMGDSAASGGYWIAADADRIFALPMTMTGSIGVTGGKFSLLGLWDKAGVNWDSVGWGENSGLHSFNQPFSDAEAARMNALMDSVYDAFIGIVAQGRKMAPAQAEKVARGRVWTGAQAVENGLVDALGGLDVALDHAATLAGASDRFGIDVIVMPRPLTPFERVMTFLETQASMGEFFRSHSGFFNGLAEALSAGEGRGFTLSSGGGAGSVRTVF